MKALLLSTIAIAASFIVSGCGGNTADQLSPQPKGEGNIPIGCAKNAAADGGRVTIYRSDGTKYDTTLADGIIMSPKLPFGMTRIEVYPNNTKLNRQAITFNVGEEQRYIAHMWPLPKNFSIRVFDIITTITDGSVVPLGETVPIGLRVRAFASSQFSPTVFVAGGIGSMDDQDNFVATHVGQGQIVIKVANTTKTINIEVR